MLDIVYELPVNLAVCVFLLGCVVLDLLFGDPQDWPHPVRVIGAALDRVECWGQRFWLGARVGGTLCVLGVTGATGLAVWGVTSLPLVGELAALYLGYAGLALGCLGRETAAVEKLLESGDLELARVHLAGLVSRDTGDMDREEMYRAVGETLAENFNDGFVAPFFWLALLGPVALWMYKAVSTIDSMWGYRNDRFEELGKAGACLDDVLAWIPARLAAVSIWVAGWCMLCPASWARIAAEARSMDSPNAGWPMSAMANAVGVRMGGATRYAGALKDKPLLGPCEAEWSACKIQRMRRVMYVAAAFCTIGLTGLGSFLEFWTVAG